MRDDRFNALKNDFDGAPLDPRDAIMVIADLIKAGTFLIDTAGNSDTGHALLSIAQDYAEFVTEIDMRDGGEVHHA
ncbi:hypothetical protein [Citrobacter sp. S-77]|uniref:hypothetical protein n=1 Tax=Citrobacter sp. S-77 TaxID=1080067 RepID=UPI0005EF4CC0|nr:hypothetical protein [Citrobacter sp. S-77]